MADVNWGILQPLNQMAPIRESSGGTLSAPGGDPYAAQKLALERQNAVSEQAYKKGVLNIEQQKLGMEQQMQPSRLQEQQARAMSAQLEAKKASEEMQFHKSDLQAYQKGGLDAYTTSLESHDPAAAATLRAAQENHKELVRTHGVAAVSDTANLWHTIVPNNYNPNSPKDNAALMDNYSKNKKLLNRLDPKLEETLGDNPTPSMVSNYAMGSVSTVYGYKQEKGLEGQIRVKAAEAQLKPTALAKAQQDVKDKQEALEAAKQSKDPTSIQQAQTELDQAYQGVQAEISGHSPIAQAESRLGGAVSNIASTAGNFINNLATPQQQTPNIPSGRVVVRDSKGNLYHLPQDQLQDAVSQGYQLVK